MVKEERSISKHIPQLPWSLTGLTAPFSLQSMESGILLSSSNNVYLPLSFLSFSTLLDGLVPRNVFRYSSFVKSANRLSPRRNVWIPASASALCRSMNSRLSLNTLNLNSLSSAFLYERPCSVIHVLWRWCTSSSVRRAEEREDKKRKMQRRRRETDCLVVAIWVLI